LKVKIPVKIENLGILAKNTAKYGILAKSQHLTKITVSVVSTFPWFSTVPIYNY